MGVTNWFLNEGTLQKQIYDQPTKEDVDRFVKLFPSAVEKIYTLCEKAYNFKSNDSGVLEILDELCDKLVSLNSQAEMMLILNGSSLWSYINLVKERYKEIILHRSLIQKSRISIAYPYTQTIFGDHLRGIQDIFSAMNSGEKFDKPLSVDIIFGKLPIDISNYQISDIIKSIITNDDSIIRRKNDRSFELAELTWYIEDVSRIKHSSEPNLPSSVCGAHSLKTELYSLAIEPEEIYDYTPLIISTVNYAIISCFLWASHIETYKEYRALYKIAEKALDEFLEECKKQ